MSASVISFRRRTSVPGVFGEVGARFDIKTKPGWCVDFKYSDA